MDDSPCGTAEGDVGDLTWSRGPAGMDSEKLYPAHFGVGNLGEDDSTLDFIAETKTMEVEHW